MPTDTGRVSAPHASKRNFVYLTSAYNIILMFTVGWNLILAIPSASNWGRGKSNLLWGILLAFLASAMTIENVASGIVVLVQLLMGNFAPPDWDVIFYPDVAHFTRTGITDGAYAQLDSLKSRSALYLLESLGASDVTIQKQVGLIPPHGGLAASHWVGWNYSYDVTGVDMRLESDPKPTLRVKGSCHTDYTWLVNSTDQGDIYRLFGGSQTYTVERQTAVDLPPMVNFFLNDKDAFTRSSNISYALIIKTAGPYSCAPGQDPWYATEKTRAYSPIAYQVQPGRPVLSCWEDRTWHLNGKDVEGPVLDTLPSPKLHNIWAGAVCPLEFQLPSQARLGRVARSAALGSASYAVAPYVLDAGASYSPRSRALGARKVGSWSECPIQRNCLLSW